MLGAGEEWCVFAAEGHPYFLRAFVWALVAYDECDAWEVVADAFVGVAEASVSFDGGYVASGSYFEAYVVGEFVLLFLVEGVYFFVGVEYGYVGEPFPVADVRGVHEDGSVVVEEVGDEFGVAYFHASHELVVGYGECFDGFEEVVAEVFVELLFDLFSFFVGFFGECCEEVLADDFDSVVRDFVEEDVDDVGEDVEDG